LKIQPNEDPRYISPGNNVSVEDAAHLTLRASPWYPEPEPLRAARELLDG
jgi:deoxyinosine 3'endonuclease (endonuclease V)